MFRWDAAPEPLGPPWPLVLASDVLYEARNVAPLLALLPRLTAAGGEVWLADPGRAPAGRFLERRRRAWRLDAIPHDGPAHVTVPPPAGGRAQRSRNALSRSSERFASRSAVPPTSTRPAMRPRKPPGCVYSLR